MKPGELFPMLSSPMPITIGVIWIVALASLAGILLRPRGIAEAWWAGGGAAILVVAGLLPWAEAAGAVGRSVDVCLFLAGMMVLSELAREAGVFDWLAEAAARRAEGSPRRLFVLVYLAGVIVTVFLSNDATAVVLTPAVLVIVRRCRVDPIPCLLACAMIANAASFVLPISNPANLVVFGAQLPPLLAWLRTFALPSVASIVVTFAALRFLLRGRLVGKIAEPPPATPLTREGRFALVGLVVAAVVLGGVSAVGSSLGWATFIVAALVLGALTPRNLTLPGRAMRGVSWSVLPLVVGLFVIVAALQRAGLPAMVDLGLNQAGAAGKLSGDFLAGFGVAVWSNGMNNLPVGLIVGTALQAAPVHASLLPAVLIGTDLGPNLSVTGSLATILWLIALRRENVAISGWQFFRVGLIAMPLALLAALLALSHA